MQESINFKFKLKRAMELLSVCHLYMLGLHMYTLIGIYLIYSLLWSQYYWLVLIYSIFYYFDFNQFDKGSYRGQILRCMPYIKHGCDYFPLKLHKECDINDERNYIFGVVPHGVCPFGPAFGFNSAQFTRLFPKLTIHICTLKSYFYYPLTRELGYLHGFTCASKKSLSHVLNNCGYWSRKGQVCTIVIGGAEEMVHAEPGECYNLILKNRKGYARTALETGAHLVPVFSFGENDVYNSGKIRDTNCMYFKFQRFFKSITTIGFPYGSGRGLFHTQWGLLPFRKAINTVIGTPIKVDRVQNPTQEQVDTLHEIFIAEIHRLFDRHKHRFEGESNKRIVLV